ncbi:MULTISPECIES: hypothetical protein [Chryseobacterium]|jgi:hypothetical protein|uniref:DUF4402 domain-containing protein n=1 Tax=Chryseobacterium indoltheticum TaxID=254 RepID=A0A3G6MXZ1_9FLAO|nr:MULTISPECIES: hypothetical protein [Chryseobacterium]AZA60394.1 hypothetical protein EG340_04790 [Chryseobacterium indoltheticum]MDQ8141675.1 hypothetical protein [Chryseobacterium sp. CFS15]
MKQFLLSAAGLLAFATASAQNVTLNVRLKPIQTLVVNTSQKVVNLEYVTKDDYQNGVTSENPDHLNIYSTGGFQVKVKASNAAMQNGGKSIATNTILIKASAGSDVLNGAQYSQDVQLSGSESTLVTSTSGGVNKKINIAYKGAGANAYINNYIAGQDPTLYTTELTYTIVSQ